MPWFCWLLIGMFVGVVLLITMSCMAVSSRESRWEEMHIDDFTKEENK